MKFVLFSVTVFFLGLTGCSKSKNSAASSSCFKLDKVMSCEGTQMQVRADGRSIEIVNERGSDSGFSASNREKSGEYFELTEKVQCAPQGYKSVFTFNGQNDGSGGVRLNFARQKRHTH
jgi:hypothetical protein